MTRHRTPRTRTGGRSWSCMRRLEVIAPNPMVTLNRAVAVAMVRGPGAGLELLAPLKDDPADGGPPPAPCRPGASPRASRRYRGGDRQYRMAARLTTSLPERRYLEAQAARLGRLTIARGQSGAPNSSIQARALAAISRQSSGVGWSALPLPSERCGRAAGIAVEGGRPRDKSPSRAPSRETPTPCRSHVPCPVRRTWPP